MKEPLFCDNHVLIAEKPPEMNTQPHERGQENLTDLMKAFVKRKYNKPGKVFLEPIHRLDQQASGLVVFARTSKALSRLQEQMRERSIKKMYLALVEGEVPLGKNKLENFLVHDEYKARVVSSSHPEAKRAELLYENMGKQGPYTLVQIELMTGRYHQIRSQFSHIGSPIAGDKKYGAKTAWKHEGIALHHTSINLQHPVTREPLSIESLPKWLSHN